MLAFFWPHPDGHVEQKHPPVTVQTYPYAESEEGPLMLDLRVPQNANPDMPGIIFVHGGGFAGGTRDSEPVADFLDNLADSGVVSASISYRLTRKGKGFGCQVTVEEKREAVHEAAIDLIAAHSWLVQQKMSLPQNWVAAGSSAGAETAIWAGYGMAPSLWAGIIGFSGAIEYGTPVPADAPPLLAIHGECDRVVPSGLGIHRGCHPQDPGAWNLCGGLCWAEILHSKGVSACTWRQCESGHEFCTLGMLAPGIQQWIVEWLRNPRAPCSSHTKTANGKAAAQEASSCPQPCNGMD